MQTLTHTAKNARKAALHKVGTRLGRVCPMSKENVHPILTKAFSKFFTYDSHHVCCYTLHVAPTSLCPTFSATHVQQPVAGA